MPSTSFPSAVSVTTVVPAAPAAPLIVSQNGKVLNGTGVAGDQFAIVVASAPSTPIYTGVVGSDGAWSADLTSFIGGASLKVKQATLTYSDLSGAFAFTAVIDWADYGNLPTFSATSFSVPPAGGVCYFPVTLSFAPLNMPVLFRARLINGSGTNRLIDGDGFTQVDTNFQRHFRIGDDPVYYVPITFKSGMTLGATCIIEMAEIRGASNDDGSNLQVTCTVVAGATTNIAPSVTPFHRAPIKMTTSGATPTQTLDIAAMKMGDGGVVAGFGSANWRSDLSDGNRTQTGNGEYGFYSDEVLYPSQPACHIIESNGAGGSQLRLHTQKVTTPFAVGATNYNYMASVIAGNSVPAWRHRLGLYEFDIIAPDRPAAWWAIWFMACTTSGGVKYWPPETDGAEGFNHVAPGRWNTGRSSTHLHSGVMGSNTRQTAIGIESNMSDMGWPAGWTFNSQHTLGVEFTDTTITMFWDHYEYSQYRNLYNADLIAQGLAWFPLVNVAVGGNSIGDPGLYNTGSGDMILKGMRYYADRTGMVLTNATIPFS